MTRVLSCEEEDNGDDNSLVSLRYSYVCDLCCLGALGFFVLDFYHLSNMILGSYLRE